MRRSFNAAISPESGRPEPGRMPPRATFPCNAAGCIGANCATVFCAQTGFSASVVEITLSPAHRRIQSRRTKCVRLSPSARSPSWQSRSLSDRGKRSLRVRQGPQPSTGTASELNAGVDQRLWRVRQSLRRHESSWERSTCGRCSSSARSPLPDLLGLQSWALGGQPRYIATSIACGPLRRARERASLASSSVWSPFPRRAEAARASRTWPRPMRPPPALRCATTGRGCDGPISSGGELSQRFREMQRLRALHRLGSGDVAHIDDRNCSHDRTWLGSDEQARGFDAVSSGHWSVPSFLQAECGNCNSAIAWRVSDAAVPRDFAAATD